MAFVLELASGQMWATHQFTLGQEMRCFVEQCFGISFFGNPAELQFAVVVLLAKLI
jgi:hypothetical protein